MAHSKLPYLHPLESIFGSETMSPMQNFSVRSDHHRNLIKEVARQLNRDPKFKDRILSAFVDLSLHERFDALSQEVRELRNSIESLLAAGAADQLRGHGDRNVVSQIADPKHKRAKREYHKSAARKRADELVLTTALTRAQIEHIIQHEYGISRDRAQAAASKAVRSLDPDNPARRTHKPPLARRVSPAQAQRMRKLVDQGLQRFEVAELLGCDRRTVWKYVHGRKKLVLPRASQARHARVD